MITEKMRLQFRAWTIMEKYFGIVKYSSYFIKLDFSDEQKKVIESINKKAEKAWEEMAKKN
jgi:hypothetical protein